MSESHENGYFRFQATAKAEARKWLENAGYIFQQMMSSPELHVNVVRSEMFGEKITALVYLEDEDQGPLDGTVLKVTGPSSGPVMIEELGHPRTNPNQVATIELPMEFYDIHRSLLEVIPEVYRRIGYPLPNNEDPWNGMPILKKFGMTGHDTALAKFEDMDKDLDIFMRADRTERVIKVKTIKRRITKGTN